MLYWVRYDDKCLHMVLCCSLHTPLLLSHSFHGHLSNSLNTYCFIIPRMPNAIPISKKDSRYWDAILRNPTYLCICIYVNQPTNANKWPKRLRKFIQFRDLCPIRMHIYDHYESIRRETSRWKVTGYTSSSTETRLRLDTWVVGDYVNIPRSYRYIF